MSGRVFSACAAAKRTARAVAVVLAAIPALAGCSAAQILPGSPLAGARDGGCTVTDFKTDGSIGGRYNAETRMLAYSRPGPDGHYRAYVSEPDGTNERRLSSPEWAGGRHQFVVDWHPSGRYLFVEVEKAVHPRSSADATPGYGAFTDLWLVTADGARAWKLVDPPNDYDHALTHAAVSPDGSRITWTERRKAPNLFDVGLWAGSYVFQLADLADATGRPGETPHLENVRTAVPGGRDQGGEVDGLAADGWTIAFYSTFRTHNLLATRIYTWDVRDDRPESIRELSTDSFSQAPRFTPDGRSLVYMSGSGADIFFPELQGADWWSVRMDGSSRRRLTFMNKRGSPQSVGHYRFAGVLSFDSDRSFYGDVMTSPWGLVGKIVKVECDAPFSSR